MTEQPIASSNTFGRPKKFSPRGASFTILPILAAILALGIFGLHTFWNNRVSLGTFYVIVILMSVNFSGRRGIIAVAASCMLLAVVGFLISDAPDYPAAAVGRSCVSLVAIVTTAIMAIRMHANTAQLLDQAKLLDLTHDAIFVRDMNDGITYWNLGAEELFGWTSKEALRRKAKDLIRTRFPIPRDAILKELLSTGRWEGELVHVERSGKEIVVASRWSLQRSKAGIPISILQTDTDITASKRAREHLADAQAALAHVTRVAALGELTTTIAHEVSQPLAGIVTNGEACLRWLDHDELEIDEVRGTITRIVRDGRRAGDVIQRMRALSRKSEPQRTPLRINDLIEETLSLLREELLDQGVSLKLELIDEKNSPVAMGDKVQLQQVLLNLIMNAMQSMAFTPMDFRELRVGTQSRADEVIIFVSDSGVGIDGVEDGLFTAFFTTKRQGIGMGLAICRSILESNGGRIWASQNSTVGATFQFALPMVEKALA